MDISSNNQLVPYHQDTRQITAYAPSTRRAASDCGNTLVKRHDWTHTTGSPGHRIRPDASDPLYRYSRRLKFPKMSQVGLRIDIYA